MTLQRRTPLRADPAKTKAWQDRSRKALPAESDKRKAERPERARVRAAATARDGGCVGMRLHIDHDCGGPLDAHEVIPRSAWPKGHLVLDNVVMVCRGLHRMIDADPTLAAKWGLHGYSWERPDP